MPHAIWVLAAGIALIVAAPASAGCWATVGLLGLPRAVGSGEVWAAELEVLQHGRTPLAEASPTVVVENPATGSRRAYRATLVDPAGARFRAEVVFPAPGTWSIAVHDGFPWGEGCARTHTFGTHVISTGGTAAARELAGRPQTPMGRATVQRRRDGGRVALALGLALGLGGLGLGAALAARSRRARGAHPA